jgi:Fe-S-cluster containining protein
MRPCETCVGECCRRYFVNLNGHDVWTIATSLRLAPEQFIDLAQEDEPTGIGFRLDATKMTFAMVLNKRPGPDGVQQCDFLMNLGGGIGRCGIYPHRPAACRVFPAQLRHGAVAFREDVVCPKGSWNVAGIDLPAWRASLLRSHMEWAIYTSVVSLWNERTAGTPRGEMHTPSEYYSFLMERYDRLAGIERELTPPEMHAIVTGWGQRAGAVAETPWERFLRRVESTIV